MKAQLIKIFNMYSIELSSEELKPGLVLTKIQSTLQNLVVKKADIKFQRKKMTKLVRDHLDHIMSQRVMISKKHSFNIYLTLELMFILDLLKETEMKMLFAIFHSLTKTRSRSLLELYQIQMNGIAQKAQRYMSLFKELQK